MSTQATQGHGEHGGGGHDEGHASWRFYVLIGVILAVITAIEVAIFYIPALDAVDAPLLIALSTAKFALVVMFFMHLKFDSPIFTGVFMVGMILASFMVVALVVLYHFLPRFDV